jgi:hypothetical protein
MSTKLLTQNNPVIVPYVGQIPAKSLLGWRMSTANAMDFVVALNTVVGTQGYVGYARCFMDPSTPKDPATGFTATSWLVYLEKSGYPRVECKPGQWVTFDGVTPLVLDDGFVQANYTVTDYAPPASGSSSGAA